MVKGKKDLKKIRNIYEFKIRITRAVNNKHFIFMTDAEYMAIFPPSLDIDLHHATV